MTEQNETEQISKGMKLDTTYLNAEELHAELEEALATVESDFKSLREKVAKREKQSKKKQSKTNPQSIPKP